MKHLLLISLLLVFILTSTMLFAEEVLSEKELYNRAEKNYEEKTYKRAYEDYTKLIDNYPKSKRLDEVEYKAANCLFQLDEYDEAIKAVEKLLERNPKNIWKAHTQLLRAQIGAEYGYWEYEEEIEEWLKKAELSYKKYADKKEKIAFYFSAGEICEQSYDIREKAPIYYLKVAKLSPKSHEAALAYYRTGYYYYTFQGTTGRKGRNVRAELLRKYLDTLK